MWGLALKDYYANKKIIFRDFFVLVIAFILFCIPLGGEKIAEEPFVYILLFSIIQISVVFNAFMSCASMVNIFIKEDEKTDWQNYLVSSPIMIKKQVLVKYIEMLLVYLLCLGYGYLTCKVIWEVNGIKISNKITLAIFFFFLLQSSFELPIIFKVGSKYGNYIKMAFGFTILFAAILYGLYGTLPPGIDQDKIIDYCAGLVSEEPDAVKYFRSIIRFCKDFLPIIASLLYAGSFLLACKLYNPEKMLDKE